MSSLPPKFLRIPAFARTHVPGDLDHAPILPQDLAHTQRDQVYAIRLRDTFLSVRHAFAIERGFVKAAILHATTGILCHAPGKDSLLLVWGIDPAVRKYTCEHIRYLDPTTHNSHTLSIAFDEDEEVTFAVQADVQSEMEAISSMTGATVLKYKNFVAIKVLTQNVETTIAQIRRFPSARIIPYNVLSGADPETFDKCITLQLRKDHDVSSLKKVSQECYTYSPNKGQLRVYVSTATSPDSMIEPFKSLDGVLHILSSSTLKTLFSFAKPPPTATSTEDDSESKAEPKKGNMVIIKQLDATPISAKTAEIISKLLKLSKPSVRNGALLGLTPEAQALSGTILNGRYLIAWELEM